VPAKGASKESGNNSSLRLLGGLMETEKSKPAFRDDRRAKRRTAALKRNRENLYLRTRLARKEKKGKKGRTFPEVN